MTLSLSRIEEKLDVYFHVQQKVALSLEEIADLFAYMQKSNKATALTRRPTDSGTKFKPLIVMSPVAPTASDDGEIELITGVPGATTVRKNGAESELAELRTFTAKEPTRSRSATRHGTASAWPG